MSWLIDALAEASLREAIALGVGGLLTVVVPRAVPAVAHVACRLCDLLSNRDPRSPS